LFLLPVKYNSLPCKEGERLNDFRIIPDKMMVEVGKCSECTDSFKVMRSFPIQNSHNLCWLHFDSLHTDDNTQVFDFLAVVLLVVADTVVASARVWSGCVFSWVSWVYRVL
jgi:hypothetical protein